MKVGWLADRPGYVGGAELTQAEFRAAAPQTVEVIDCPPGGVVRGLDVYVVNNCVSYGHHDMEPLATTRTVKYLNDLWPAGDPLVRLHLLKWAHVIFTSPLHRERFPHKVQALQTSLIPPALDLLRFREARARANGRKGAVCVGRMAYGKGVDLLERHPKSVHVWSTVPVASSGSVSFQGSLAPEDVADVLARYQTFVFKPTAIEPFGRAVVEAWAAGCDLEVNRNVGALHWIREDPQALETAAADFWRVVLHG